jgi:hypothetical protein
MAQSRPMTFVPVENDRLPTGLYVGMVHLRDYRLHHLVVQGTCVRMPAVSIVNRGDLVERYGELRSFDGKLRDDVALHLSCIHCGAGQPSLTFVIDQS